MQQWQPLVEPWTACGPAEAAVRLRDRPGLAWLDSSSTLPRSGRWSVVASDPRWTLTATGSDVVVADAGGARRLTPGALTALARAVATETAAFTGAPDGAPALPFLGGAIGYLGFELGREIERLPATTRDDVGAPDLAFGWYDAALVWDHERDRGWLAGRAGAVGVLAARLARPAGTAPLPAPTPHGRSGRPLEANMRRERYLDAVDRARAYIAAGDIYQVNLAQRFALATDEAGFELYRRLRDVSPAPFAAYLDLRGPAGGVEVLSSSPERFLLVDGEHVETRPIKGTRPRGSTAAADRQLADELRASAKDHAEHVMIVDLERNDLGRIARVGSVAVPELAALESFAQVHHLTSTVTARVRPGVDVEALLRATFPGGSISGAPKIRALEIIDELEPTVRGVYTGAIGYLSAHGRIDLSIAIRTITLAEGTAYMHVGGAIVHDSEPEAEYAETMAKARGMARALGAMLPDEDAGVTEDAALAALAPGSAPPPRDRA